MSAHIFIAGGTGYMGRALIPELMRRGHKVRALARPGSGRKLPSGCETVIADALDAATYRASIAPSDTFVHLVGVSHPSPAKAAEFRSVDLASVREAVSAASHAGVRHFIYVSVAHPAPMMKAYVEARSEGEALIRAAGLNATILRPWYVLGPGHWWPVILRPVYWVMERVPATRAGAAPGTGFTARDGCGAGEGRGVSRCGRQGGGGAGDLDTLTRIAAEC